MSMILTRKIYKLSLLPKKGLERPLMTSHTRGVREGVVQNVTLVA